MKYPLASCVLIKGCRGYQAILISFINTFKIPSTTANTMARIFSFAGFEQFSEFTLLEFISDSARAVVT